MNAPPDPPRRRKHSALKRLLAAVACLVFVVGLVMALFVGFNMVVVLLLLSAVAGIAGPAALGSGVGGFFAIIATALELIVEGLMMIIDAITGIFSS